MASFAENKCKSYCHVTTNLQIHVLSGDITTCKADAIVSPSDSWLVPGGGVAKAVARKGGSSMVKECQAYIQENKQLPIGGTLVTDAGNLPCHKVIHVVGPRRVDYKSDRECGAILKWAFDNVLVEATKHRLTSVAIPGVSAGLYGVPQRVVTDCTFESINDFCKKNKKPCLQTIYLVDMNTSMVQAWLYQIDKLLKEEKYRCISAMGGSRNPVPMDLSNSVKITPKLSNDTVVNHTKLDKNDIDTYCSICMCTATDPKTLDKCKHTFCTECIDMGFKIKPACPVCGEIYGKVTGNQPNNGQMKYSVDNTIHLPGYEYCGAIVIRYSFPDGVQTHEHSNPGKPYSGTRREAYLPNSKEGQKILGLLKQAFDARLIFTVGVSRTTGQQNTVTWNDIHHKTRPYGGPERFGYPDPTYLSRVTDELAAKGIK